MDKAITGVTAVVGVILSVLSFYFGAYLPYVDGQNTPTPTPVSTSTATPDFTPLIDAVNRAVSPEPQPVSEPEPVSEPLTASIISDDTWGEAPATFEFEADVTGGIAPYSYSWDFGDFSEEDYGQFVSHEYEDAGDYYVELTVTDAEEEIASTGIDITVEEPYVDEYTDEDEEYTDEDEEYTE